MTEPVIIDETTGEVIEFDRAAAERRAERIAHRLDTHADDHDAIMVLIREAIARRDHLALGYRSPGDYISDRFGGTLQRLSGDIHQRVVRELDDAGLSQRAIAHLTGVSRPTAASDISARGKDLPRADTTVGRDGKTYPRTGIPHVAKAERVRQVTALAAEGKTAREVAEHLGLSSGRVKVIASDAGIALADGRKVRRVVPLPDHHREPEPEPEPDPKVLGKSEWADRVQAVSAHAPLQSLTDHQLDWLLGAVEYLTQLIDIESRRRTRHGA